MIIFLKEVQSVYRLQGVDINDKHIEIMIRQMLKKVKIEEPGDGDMLPGSMVDTNEFDVKNEALIAAGKEPATASPVLFGHYQSGFGYGFLPFRRILPRNHESSDGCRYQRERSIRLLA